MRCLQMCGPARHVGIVLQIAMILTGLYMGAVCLQGVPYQEPAAAKQAAAVGGGLAAPDASQQLNRQHVGHPDAGGGQLSLLLNKAPGGMLSIRLSD